MAWVEQSGQHSWRVRYRRHTGTTGAIPGFPDRKVAETYARDMETDQRRQVWIDPADSRTTLTDWAARWLPAQDLDPRTIDNYRSYLRCQILPHFGDASLGEITALDIDTWTKQVADAGYAAATIASWVKLLSMILTDAVDQHLIPTNPVRQRGHRGRRCRTLARERVWPTPEQVLRIANQASALGGTTARLLIITAAWTGCRRGELAALHRDNLHLDTGHLTVDPDHGSLHECGGRRWLGPPKTPSSARTITLPPFLVRLLRQHLQTHPYEFVFTNPCGTWLWRSSFHRRILRPAIDGTRKPGARIYPVCPGLTFHGLRHSHTTWLIAGGAPEIAQARRLGHHLPNRVVETYSHVAPEVETRLLADLQRRWHKATRSRYPKRPQQRKPAMKTRRPIPPSLTTRQRPIPAAPLTVGKRDNTRHVQRGNEKQVDPLSTTWSGTPQKHPTRDSLTRLQTISQDQPKPQESPSDQPKQPDRRGLITKWS
ncbi:site-specific integrase [Amycolatopsis acidiphila]|uniref:Site-specific integrase n=1 Tax=Amycolatopsis acidiphila TaxID=715473 RepID=A0A558AI07_9PSEU|nr:site-specific integrase [Amycolatopsis acidiphila]TVT23916.1 site-specific integrase [Amycolatopsis acidiphila]UIJ61107.1 site-specific integrase [Amycolatopsis acidiphila]GHG86733.1 hypothetical protein GCM10017788_60090 [Amycolatopsis acidiphila]